MARCKPTPQVARATSVARSSTSTRPRSITPATGLLAPTHRPENRISKTRARLKPPPKKAARSRCTVCFRELAKSAFPKSITQTCTHNITTCKACLKIWIAAQLDNTTYDKLRCPECPQTMANADVQANAHARVYERFNELERRDIADKTPGWRWCLAPSCKAGQVHQLSIETPVPSKGKGKGKAAKEAEKVVHDDVCVCNECGARACVPCDRPYHEGETCTEYQKRMAFEKDEAATLKTIEAECKQCPGCKKNIQRNGGCDHVICTQCEVEFCWLCLTTYAVIREQRKHAQDCMYALPGRIDPHAPGLRVAGPHRPQVANNQR